MTAWLDTLDYLTPEHRRILRRHDLDAPVARAREQEQDKLQRALARDVEAAPHREGR